MLVSIKRTKIEKREENRVKSDIIFAPYKRQTADNLKFHEDGIFSKKIFGKIHKCECGEVVGEGFCEKCQTRVISIENMPQFYIDLGIEVAAAFADYKNSGIDPDLCKEIINYEKFIYDNEVHQLNEDEETNLDNYDEDRIKIGVEALKYLGVSDEWIEENTTDFISISHPIYRPVVIGDNGIPFITGINTLYSEIIANINNVKEMHSIAKGRKLFLMAEYRVISKIYNKIISALFDELQNVKFSIVKSEIISHPISGAVRGTLINRHDIHEDVILIGDTFIETLFPYLYKKHNGNVAEINKELIEEDYVVLLNRAPTISHLSTVGMKPRVASIYPFGKIEGTNDGLLHNYKYVKENPDKIGIFHDKEGDIEKFGQGLEDGIDTLGLRCLAVNPIMMDGLAGDFDGDVLLCIALYSKDALEEARNLLPSKCYTNYANGTIRNHIIEDFIFTED